MSGTLLFIEVGGWSPAMVILDGIEKLAGIQVIQVELNDQPGVCLKCTGSLAGAEAAAEQARAVGERMGMKVVADVIAAPAEAGLRAIEVAPDFNPLLEQSTVVLPAGPGPVRKTKKEKSSVAGFAIGLIETQGFTAVFEALDTALKAASVEVLAREKLGGGYITVVIKGDVAAVQAAVDAAKGRVEGLGRLIAAHVIPSPSPGVLAILPKL